MLYEIEYELPSEPFWKVTHVEANSEEEAINFFMSRHEYSDFFIRSISNNPELPRIVQKSG
jgi:hypothetical protein